MHKFYFDTELLAYCIWFGLIFVISAFFWVCDLIDKCQSFIKKKSKKTEIQELKESCEQYKRMMKECMADANKWNSQYQFARKNFEDLTKKHYDLQVERTKYKRLLDEAQRAYADLQAQYNVIKADFEEYKKDVRDNIEECAFCVFANECRKSQGTLYRESGKCSNYKWYKKFLYEMYLDINNDVFTDAELEAIRQSNLKKRMKCKLCINSEECKQSQGKLYSDTGCCDDYEWNKQYSIDDDSCKLLVTE